MSDTHYIAKAHATAGVEIPDVTLSISGPVPEFTDDPQWIKKLGVFYESEAERIADALCKALPGGTLDALICNLLKRKASLLRVPMFDK